MVVDILKWALLYTLVLFAFGCGMNQLLWYYADLEYDKCYSLPGITETVHGYQWKQEGRIPGPSNSWNNENRCVFNMATHNGEGKCAKSNGTCLRVSARSGH